MLLRNSDKEWEAFGRKDPYYGVLSHEKFHKDRLNDESLKEFFRSGQEHIDFVLETIRTSLEPKFSPANALDFGCGIGRCSIPLSSLCRSVVGVDVSDSMLQQAKKICLEQSITNLDLVKADDALTGVSGQFDFIHSCLVFQHISPKRGMNIFTRLVQRLSDNGVAAVQFLYYREESVAVKVMGRLRAKIPLMNNFANLLLRKPFWEPLMEKNVYDLNELLAVLHRSGCGTVHIKCFGQGRFRSAILFFQKRQEDNLHDTHAYYV